MIERLRELARGFEHRSQVVVGEEAVRAHEKSMSKKPLRCRASSGIGSTKKNPKSPSIIPAAI